MSQSKNTIYNTVIQTVIDNEERLPSLPAVTLKIRQAISNPDSTVDEIASLIRLDPSLSALLLKYGASPLYKRPVPPNTIEAVLSMIGMPALENLVMTHSIKSLFILKDPQLKKLFQLSWERMIYKAAISLFLAKKMKLRPAEQAMTSSLLTEIGTLVLLSAFSKDMLAPDTSTYIKLCKKYSKPLTGIVLNKWGISKNIINVGLRCGHWDLSYSKKLGMVDIINMAIYSTVKHQSSNDDLPPIETIVSYKKLPQSISPLTDEKELAIIKENLSEIDDIISSLK
ncbi:MAG: HDOD domain-containing protein [Cellvibrionaceae bacterium]